MRSSSQREAVEVVQAEGAEDRTGGRERPDAGLRPLDIVVITVRFPMVSETFISARLRTLQSSGNRLRVSTMLGPKPDASKLIEERQLGGLEIDQSSGRATLIGLVKAVGRPRLLGKTLSWLWKCNRNRFGHLLRALAIVPRSFQLLAELEKDRPDVLHLEWGHFPVVAARLVQWSLPEVVTSVSLIAYDLNTEFGGTIDVVRDADVVRTQAAINVDQIIAFTGVDRNRIAVIHDGVDVARLERMTAVKEKEPGRVVCVGRLVPGKAVDDVIEVFAAARTAVPHATLHILGDGPERGRLEKLVATLGIGEAVEFLGTVSHLRVMTELTQAEVLLHLSRAERLPNVVKEAMACECLPITTRTVGIEELVEHGMTGYIIEHQDRTQAVSTLIDVLTSTSGHEQMVADAKRFITRNFDHHVNVGKLVSLWHEVLPTPEVRPDSAALQ